MRAECERRRRAFWQRPIPRHALFLAAAAALTAAPILKEAGVAGYEGSVLCTRRPTAPCTSRVQGLDEDEELRGLAEDEELRGLDEDEELRGFDEDEELRGLSEEEELRGLDEDEELQGFAEDEELRGSGKTKICKAWMAMCGRMA